MSILTMIQDCCNVIGIDSPNTVIGNVDRQISQLLALANKTGESLAREPFQSLNLEATFTTVATESQGAVSTIAPGFKYIINETIFNRDLKRPVFGPLSPQRWQQLKAANINGPWNQFRIRAGNIIFIPAPAAGQHCYFEYRSKNWATDSTGVTTKEKFSVDTDLILFDEGLFKLALIWRWKHAKTLDYAEDFAEYQRVLLDELARDGGKDRINLTGEEYLYRPAIMVPEGSWSI